MPGERQLGPLSDGNRRDLPSIMTICPRRCDFEVSDCQVGTVDVFIPIVCQRRSSKTDHATLTVTKTSDEARCDKLTETERRALDSSANDHDAAADKDGLPATEHVAFQRLITVHLRAAQRKTYRARSWQQHQRNIPECIRRL